MLSVFFVLEKLSTTFFKTNKYFLQLKREFILIIIMYMCL